MCGIAGAFGRATHSLPADVETMVAALGHRGPDDCGTFFGPGVGIAQSRLSIIDLSGGHQPMCSPDGKVVLSANGEIYNYIELRQELESRGHRFSTKSDSETILFAYLEYGLDFVKHLIGMFAFALYDERKGLLILARDRLGIKPLYRTEANGVTYFASELKALLAVVPNPVVEAEALAQYLQHQFITGRGTVFKGIERLAPGELVLIRMDAAPERIQYWSPLGVRVRSRSEGEATEEFEALFGTVMEEHLRSDVPLGLFLSGGTDSAAILAKVSELRGGGVPTYTVSFDATDLESEAKDAARLSERFGAKHTEIVLDRQQVFERLPFVTWNTDDLLRDHACLPTSFLAERVSQDVKVVLTGEGGDEVFAGYGRYRRNGLRRLLPSLLRPGSGGFRTRGLVDAPPARMLMGTLLDAEARCSREFFVRPWQAAPSEWTDLARSQYVDLTTYLADDLLVKSDRVLMAFGLEGRVPFVDHRVVEFGFSLPDRLRVSGRQGKVLLKQWAQRRIPAEYLSKPKRGFHVPIRQWLTPEFVALLSAELLRSEGIRAWFNADQVKAFCQRYATTGHGGTEIWALLQFAIWHRIFVEKRPKQPPLQVNPLEFLAETAIHGC